ncbi:hypothetical protein RFI_16046 [Reticulomyxa filosa]|uniref:Flippase-like domain-containing protein n=1 Tax=Reticulomyxa filosa TaxID=46433 RepID=X6N4E2_RETFI|nr:hypothetical protein RFI_16046 [Reticulomyxa filosa]|eukprot:ETO21160.1 hypothetical protein RFI_16046 [Reticulomyxa filosa]
MNKLWFYLKEASLSCLFVALIVSVISYIFSGLRSQFYFEKYGLKLFKKFAVALYFLGSSFNIVLLGGIGGDGYKIFYLWKLEKFSKIKSLRIIFYERVNGVYVLILFGLIFAFFSDFVHIIPYFTYLMTLGLITVTPAYLLGAKYMIRDKIDIAVGALKFSFFVQLTQYIMYSFIIIGIEPTLSFHTWINFAVLFAISSIVAIIPITIGGAGLRDLTFLYGTQFISTEHKELGIAVCILIFTISSISCLPGVFFIYNINSMKRKF